MHEPPGRSYAATEAVSIRYPGRACLLGEHCDWAGGASLAVPLPIGVRVDAGVGAAGTGVTLATMLEGQRVTGSWDPAGAVDPDGGPLRFVPAALRALASRGVHVPATDLSVTSDLPPGRGFSSSAAFTLAVLDALSRRGGRQLDRSTLARLAFEVEHDLLGVDCGLLDQIACAEGAPVFIRWDGRDPAVRRVPPGTTFHLVALALPAARDTRRILAVLNRHFLGTGSEARNREGGGPGDGATGAVRAALAVFASAAEAGAAAMEAGSAAGLASAMNAAQEAYEVHLHSVLPELRAPLMLRTCADLRRDGALAAKFSGAGGEGSVIALFDAEDGARAAAERLENGEVGSALYCPVGRGPAGGSPPVDPADPPADGRAGASPTVPRGGPRPYAPLEARVAAGVASVRRDFESAPPPRLRDLVLAGFGTSVSPRSARTGTYRTRNTERDRVAANVRATAGVLPVEPRRADGSITNIVARARTHILHAQPSGRWGNRWDRDWQDSSLS